MGNSQIKYQPSAESHLAKRPMHYQTNLTTPFNKRETDMRELVEISQISQETKIIRGPNNSDLFIQGNNFGEQRDSGIRDETTTALA